MALIKGIDVSRWQGDVNFANLYDKTDNAPISFIIMKLSQRTSKDKKFETYYSSAKAQGKYKLGCYIYNKVYTNEQARAEAEFAVKALNGKKMDAWVWLDMEDPSMVSLGKDKLTEIIDIEAEILSKAGYKVGIYSNPNWYKNVLNGKELSKRYKFWIARYPKSNEDNGTMKESLSPKGTYPVSIWQYSSKGKVNGINGNVDLDILYENIFDVNANNTSTSTVTTSQSNSNVSEYIKIGQFHANNFTGVTIPLSGKFDSNTKKQAVRVLQHAMNMDYRAGLKVDGIWGNKSNLALGKHYTRKGESQYMVSALIILLLLHGYPMPLYDNPAKFDATLEAVVKQYQKDNKLPVTGVADANTYKSLIQ